ncbi:MAG: SpoIIE family protein phosphatase [Methanospirillum sp.]
MGGARRSLRLYLIQCIVVVIVCVIGFLTVLSYGQATGQLAEQDQHLRAQTGANAVESVRLVDEGLRVVDDSMNRELVRAFDPFLAAYDGAGGDPDRLDLAALQRELGDEVEGDLDLYVISPEGVIVASTVPEVLGLDFSARFPDYYRRLQGIMANGTFSADRVVRSVTNASAGGVTGELRKFAFMPVTSRRHLLELGLSSPILADDRSRLSYVAAAGRAVAPNPDVRNVSVYDAQRNLLAEDGSVAETPVDAGTALLLDRALGGENEIEVREANGSVRQFLRVDLNDAATASNMALVLELDYAHRLAAAQAEGILLFHLATGAAAIVIGVIAAFGVGRFVSRPVAAIVEDVEAIAEGDLDRRIRRMPNREFEQLVVAINRMVGTIRQYGTELERRQAEVAIAAEIQRAFLPRVLPDAPGFDLAAVSRPAREVGGDLHDLVPLTAGRVAVVCADVSGKGIPAALFMALTRTVIRAAASRYAAPAKVVRAANESICEDAGERGTFVTTFYGVLRPERRTFRYVNAGHNPPLLLRASGAWETLEPTGPALGLLCGAEYGEAEIGLETRDLLLLYTDGVVEAIDAAEKEFGEDRLRAVVAAHRDGSAAAVADAILAAVDAHVAGAEQFDDITLVVCRATGEG